MVTEHQCRLSITGFWADLVRAMCIASLVVPVFALSRVARAEDPPPIGPLQLEVSSFDDVQDALTAMATGESIDSVWFEAQDPTRYSNSFQVDFYEELFGGVWGDAEAVYHLQLNDSDELDASLGELVLGATNPGDPFLVSLTWVEESDLSAVSIIDQDNLQAAGIERVWAIEGVCTTELGSYNVIAAVFYGVIDGIEYWRFMPILEPESDFIDIATSNYLMNTAQGPGSTQPSPPVQSYSICADRCQRALDLCYVQSAEINALCIMLGVTAFAVCVATLVIRTIWVPFFGSAAGAALMLRCLAVVAGEVAACLAYLALARRHCRGTRDLCNEICCETFPDECPV